MTTPEKIVIGIHFLLTVVPTLVIGTWLVIAIIRVIRDE